MRILYGSGNLLVSSMSGGGASTQITGFISAMEKAGHQIELDISGEQKIYPNIRSRKWLAWIRENIPISWMGYESLQVLNNKRIQRRLININLSNYDLLWQRYELFTTAYASIAKSFDLPSVFFIDAPLIEEREIYSHLWLKGHAIECLKRNIELSNLVISVSEPIADYIREETGQADLEISVVPNGFSTHILNSNGYETERIKKLYFGPFDGTIIGFIGSPKTWHRLDYLVLVAKRLSEQRDDYRVLIVGDGPDLPAEKKLVDDLGIRDLIKFTGQIDFENIGPYLNALDIGVMPDSNLYGSPMKIIEYMACGAVVVAPNLAPIASLCTDGTDCLLFQKGDLDSLFSCINQLLDSPRLMELYKTNAATKAINHYSWDARVEQIEQIIQGVLVDYS